MKGFLQGNWRAFLSTISFLKPQDHIVEQAYWRTAQIKKSSPLCLEQGQCKECGCSTAEIVFEDRSCKGDCYPEMMNPLIWNIYKIENNITVKP